MALVDITGKTFGRLFVIRITDGCGKIKYWDCRCECGTEKSIFGGDLKRGTTKSCGCLQKEQFSERLTTHGMSFHPAYRNWVHAKVRCYDPNNEEYPNYGGRGITVCEHWQNFANFWEDMGPTWEKGLSLDRFPDVNGNYEKDNCRWATAKMQANNRRDNVIIDTPLGAMTVTQASEAFGLARSTLMKRIESGRPQSEWFGAPTKWVTRKHPEASQIESAERFASEWPGVASAIRKEIKEGKSSWWLVAGDRSMDDLRAFIEREKSSARIAPNHQPKSI